MIGAQEGKAVRADLITQSLERAAELGGDLTPRVYERLFCAHPELAPLFRESGQLVQGEMLARAIETILDFVGDRAYAANMIAAEAANHQGYEIAPETFVVFFRVIADTLRDLLGADWTGETDAAWRDLVAELSAFARSEEVPA